MPYVISDELYEGLMENLRECRLLGIMARLERLRTEALEIEKVEVLEVDGKRYWDYWVDKEAVNERETDGD